MSGSGAFYTNNGNYPHGGTGYMYFGVNNNVSGQTYQTVTIPTTATGTLTFWFNCSSSEGIDDGLRFPVCRSPQHQWHIASNPRDLQQQGQNHRWKLLAEIV